ncbi:unnamed protein product [Sphagnum tenellum]
MKKQAQPLLCRRQSHAQEEETKPPSARDKTRGEETILSLFCSPKCVVSIARRGQKGKKGRRDGEGGAREEGTRQELVSSRSRRASTAHGSGAAART